MLAESKKGEKFMNDKELHLIVGGGWLTATFFNSVSRAITAVADLGRSLGTSIRMFVTGKRC